MFHRCYTCPSIIGRAKHCLGESFFNSIIAAGDSSPLANQLLMPLPIPTPPDSVPRVKYINMEPGTLFDPADGKVYGDGSCYNPASKWLARAGFAAVQVDQGGEVIRAIYGNVPASLPQTSLAAEYLAFVSAATHASLACEYVGDCQDVLSAFNAGQVSAMQSKGPHACIWKNLFMRHPTYRQHIVAVHKVKAHQCLDNVFDPVGALHVRGNFRADELAKEGGLLHSLPVDEVRSFKCNEKQLSTLAYHMIDTLRGLRLSRLEVDGKVRRLPKGVAMRSIVKGDETPHRYVWHNNMWICSVCCVRTSSLSSVRSKSSACRGPPLFAGLMKEPRGHSLVVSSCDNVPFLFCTVCYRYANPFPRKLTRVCPGSGCANSSERFYLVRQRHPVSKLRISRPIALHGNF